MKSIDNYKNLCIDIETQQIIINDIIKEIKQLRKLAFNGPKEIKGMDYSQGPGGSPIHIPLDRLVDRLDRAEKRLVIEKEILEKKLVTKKKVDEELKKLDGIDAKVVYLRDIQKRKLQDIAEQLGYSKRQIERISARNKKLVGDTSVE